MKNIFKTLFSKKEVEIALAVVEQQLKDKERIVAHIQTRIDFYKTEEPRQESTVLMISELNSLKDWIKQ